MLFFIHFHFREWRTRRKSLTIEKRCVRLNFLLILSSKFIATFIITFSELLYNVEFIRKLMRSISEYEFHVAPRKIQTNLCYHLRCLETSIEMTWSPFFVPGYHWKFPKSISNFHGTTDSKILNQSWDKIARKWSSFTVSAVFFDSEWRTLFHDIK